MIKAVLEHPSGSIDLYEGETVIGRGLACQVRFNNHTVSRRHVSISVHDDTVMVRDLSSRNGTWINDVELHKPAVLEDGDVLQLGAIRLRLTLGEARRFMEDVVTSPGTAMGVPTGSDPSLRVLSEGAWGGRAAVEKRAASPTGILPVLTPSRMRLLGTKSAPVRLVSDPEELALPEEVARTCPDCRTQVPISQNQCAVCGYKWQRRGPLSNTQPVQIVSLTDIDIPKQEPEELERRRATRQPIEVPVIYHSPNLSFDATAKNLSRSGMFVESELLDEEGTRCILRVLPDGGPAVSIGGVVRHVVAAATEDDPHSGMGIRFTKMNEQAVSWTWSVLEQHELA